MKNNLLIVLFTSILTSVAWGCLCRRCTDERVVVRTDTIKVAHPVAIDSAVVKYVQVEVPAMRFVVHRDTLLDSIVVTDTLRDSVIVELPVSQKVYADSTYKAWVSGYMPSLDSIQIYRRTEIRTKVEQERFGFGVQGGVGITPKGVQPYIGLGIQIRI